MSVREGVSVEGVSYIYNNGTSNVDKSSLGVEGFLKERLHLVPLPCKHKSLRSERIDTQLTICS